MKNIRDILAQNLKAYRRAHQLNQDAFSAVSGVSKETISMIERGHANLKLDTLHLLAVSMHISIQELVSELAVTYLPLRKEVCIDGKTVVTYGIGLVQSFEMTELFLDVSTDQAKIASVAALCNQLELSPIHFLDIIEDVCLDGLLV